MMSYNNVTCGGAGSTGYTLAVEVQGLPVTHSRWRCRVYRLHTRGRGAGSTGYTLVVEVQGLLVTHSWLQF